MRTIGIRVSPQYVYFAIAQENESEIEILIADKIIVPKVLEIPDVLSHLRVLIYTIVYQYKVDSAVIRRIEDNSQTVDLRRANIEGVLQELIGNCRVQKYKTCKISQLAALVDCKSNELKECIAGKNLLSIENWEAYRAELRESIICALAAFEI